MELAAGNQLCKARDCQWELYSGDCMRNIQKRDEAEPQWHDEALSSTSVSLSAMIYISGNFLSPIGFSKTSSF
jgi:hypothetical protein